MATSKFNLKVIQNLVVSQAKSDPTIPSRRTLLKFFGIGIFAWNPFMSLFGAIRNTAFVVKRRSGSLSFILPDNQEWNIDTRMFSGRPVVELEHHEKAFIITLKNAFFPATKLTADFQANVYRDMGEWYLKINSQLLGQARPVLFISWLKNETSLNFTQNTKLRFSNTQGDFNCIIPGGSLFSFYPDWKIQFSNSALTKIRLEHLSNEIEVQAGSWQPTSNHPVLKTKTKATHFTFKRGNLTQLIIDNLKIHEPGGIQLNPSKEHTSSILLCDENDTANTLCWSHNAACSLQYLSLIHI
jgi:hypothetical protein